MKRKLLTGFTVVAMATVTILNVGVNVNDNIGLSSMGLLNVEALAQSENSGGYGYVNCDGHNIQCTGNGSYTCCK